MKYIVDPKLEELVKKQSEYTLQMRRYFHANPEIGMKEYNTAKVIRDELTKMGIPYLEAGETGTIGIIEGNKDSENILVLRADIDALNVKEEVDVEFKSKNEGLMHACGHDSHAATLLSAAKIFNEQYKGKFDGKIYLLFQPGEETTKGALAIIDTGLLNNVKAFYSQHVWAPLQIGKIESKAGPFMTGARVFYITVKGVSGHGSMLEKTRNPIIPASSIVLALQSIINNNISALETGLICVGGINGGNQFNAVCDECKIIGTTRFASKKIDETLCKRIEELSTNIAEAYGCKAEVEYSVSISALCTDEKLTNIAFDAYKDVVGENNIEVSDVILGSEDFAEYCNIAPCTYGFIGCRNEDIDAKYDHHSSKFKIDEDCLDICVATFIEFSKKYFNID